MPKASLSNAPRPSSSKKRRPDGANSNKPTKNSQKITNYFPQLYPLPSGSNQSENQPVPLNDEQKAVLDMVVDQGKNVFFTGAAGTRSLHTPNSSLSYAFAVSSGVSFTRNRKITTAPSHHRDPQEEAQETRRRFCDSQHRDGRLKYRRYVPLSPTCRNSTPETFSDIYDFVNRPPASCLTVFDRHDRPFLGGRHTRPI